MAFTMCDVEKTTFEGSLVIRPMHAAPGLSPVTDCVEKRDPCRNAT
jgi:hypothetical protein